MTTSKTKLHLKVVFDTNVIYNQSTSDLLTKETIELLEKHSKPTDIKISWHLPEIVLNERRFQMRKRGVELFPYIEKLEKLLGHNIGITEQIIKTRIDESITISILKYNIEIEKIIIEKVKWEEIIECASYRIPPFEDNKTEKGFRDSLILETLMQLITASPISVSSCRIILITNDKLLIEATKLKTVGKKNVSIFTSIEELESLINTLDSKIKEEFISTISTKAKELFFMSGEKDTLYYKENISSIIVEQFANEFAMLPENAYKREVFKILVSNPGFEKKVKQKIFWKTVITFEENAIGYKNNYNAIQNTRLSGLMNTIGIGGISATSQPAFLSPAKPQQSNLLFTGAHRNQFSELSPLPQEVIISTGKSKFEIFWSVSLTVKNTLKTPKIESINLVETIWE